MIPAVLPTYARAPLSFVRGEGVWLTEADGSRYLDLGAGIAVNVLGHAHPALVAALTAQAGALWHTSNLYRIPAQEALAEALVAATFADTVFFTNSGTEAAELAIKMARKYWHERGTPRSRILTFEGAFHGRSTGAIAAAGSEKMTRGYGPLMPGFTVLPFGDHPAFEAAMDDSVAAVMVEPVQCGMGRTGRLFAHEWAGIAPDIMMVAKGIGGGFPLGAVLATEAAAAGMTAGSHGSTYGGNPLACAVGLEVMRIVANDEFLADVRRRAGTLRQKLEGLVAAHPDVFADVRGQGLMLGLGCKLPNGEVVKAGYGAHVLTVPGGDNVIRLLPPLNITEEEIAEGVARLDRAASALSAGRADGAS
jgi:acetylornithine/N-succinyldiaminopimelate aminotransferase